MSLEAAPARVKRRLARRRGSAPATPLTAPRTLARPVPACYRTNALVHWTGRSCTLKAMKSHRQLSARQEALAERNLVAAIVTLRSVEECRAFLRDLCTPAELQAMADRWAVVECLRRGLPYREIHRQTAVSITTIGRVARYLAQGNGGYVLAAQRIDDGQQGEHTLHESPQRAATTSGSPAPRAPARRSAHGGSAHG